MIRKQQNNAVSHGCLVTDNVPSTQLSSALRNVSNSATVLSSTDPGLIVVLIC